MSGSALPICLQVLSGCSGGARAFGNFIRFLTGPAREACDVHLSVMDLSDLHLSDVHLSAACGGYSGASAL